MAASLPRRPPIRKTLEEKKKIHVRNIHRASTTNQEIQESLHKSYLSRLHSEIHQINEDRRRRDSENQMP